MSLTLAGAPRGARVGFVAAGDATQQVVVTVAPKLWRLDAGRILAVTTWPAQRHHSLLLYETDRLHVTAPDPEPQRLLTRCLQVSRRTDTDGPMWDSSLIAPDLAPSPNDLLDARKPGEDDDVSVTDLLQLFDRLDILAPRVDDLTGLPRRSPLHRPLLYRRLLDEVLARINSARRGYRPVTATRASVRGRIEPASALRYAINADPRLVCHYDELTESTILLGIICAALEWIADGRGVRSPFQARYAEPRLRHDAVTLRRALAEVMALAPRTAIAAGSRLRLNRLDQPWTAALQYSLAVLAETEHVAHSKGPRLIDPVELSIPTDQLWETIVHKVLLRCGFDPVLEQGAQPADLVVDPWLAEPPTKGSGTRPDNVAWMGHDMWIIDAKYKNPPLGALPERGDQYQMFAYSHLVAEPSSVLRYAALVYPGGAPTRKWRRGRDDSLAPRHLITVRIPFPTATQVRTMAAWHVYLDDAAQAFAIATAGITSATPPVVATPSTSPADVRSVLPTGSAYG